MHSSRVKPQPTGAGVLVASTKRKTPVRCAAANDEEDLGRLFDPKVEDKDREEKRPRGDTAVEEAAEAEKSARRRKKRKEFAWMDSESEEGGEEAEEEEGEGEGGQGGGGGGDGKASAEDQEEKKDEDEDAEVTVEALDEVQSFGRMTLMAPALQKWLQCSRRSPSDVAATCRALARTKFFDGDILEDLYAVLRRLLRAEKMDAAQTQDAIQCLKSLNAYDRSVFSAVSKAFKAKTASMEAGMRNVWLEIFRGFSHDAEKDFLQLLEVPPVPPNMPSYRKVRCWHHSRGLCVLDSACTFSHDHRAPLSLGEGGREDWWRSKSVMMTQNQKTLGDGAYGLGPLGRGALGSGS